MYTIDIFTENGHDRNTLTNIESTYETSINTKSTIRITPRKLRTSWLAILGPKLKKGF